MAEEEHAANETNKSNKAKEISLVELSVRGDRILGSQIVETPFIRSIHVSLPPMEYEKNILLDDEGI
jgi:hypothetical protein